MNPRHCHSASSRCRSNHDVAGLREYAVNWRIESVVNLNNLFYEIEVYRDSLEQVEIIMI